ncbi:Rpn family recombination-promoting nuclease/putative transposase [Carnobacterium maltaromaticum]|uniref:Rpn family recombination-promoting nuclease/putative transposase n=1 Tax=Carnobacterium maltaromaticum TaxID=2751 RepID=UPI00295EA4FE|nr:Rpn family recombination-promoting nuclease/putative transposase [Carnobacterium maltaromaticum]
MSNQKVRPVNDILFKKVFGSPKYRHILIGFIKDILDLDIEEVMIENPYNIDTFYQATKEKQLLQTEVDVLARLKDQSLVTIEIQLRAQAYFKERALYYAAEKYISNYGREDVATLEKKKTGAKYSSLYPVYGINILEFTLFKEDANPLHSFTLYDNHQELHFVDGNNSRLFTLAFLELKKNTTKTQKHLRYWIQYFTGEKVVESAPSYIKEAYQIVDYQNLEREERTMIDAAEKAREDLKATIIYAEREGKHLKQLEIAKKC